MTSPPLTTSINGLVGHLTQPLNHDCQTKRAWVRARIAVRPLWSGIPYAIPVAECWQTVRLWRVELIFKKIVTTVLMLTE